MGKELNLDDMAREMRNQQYGSSNNKLAWNPKTMKFEQYSNTERIPEGQSVTNDVAGKGWYYK